MAITDGKIPIKSTSSPQRFRDATAAELISNIGKWDSNVDVIIDLATKGLVLKDTQATAHYWRITVSNAGALVVTDLGTTKP